MSTTSGRIAGYDAILSVSEEAINRQLNILWNSTAGPSGPTKIKGMGDAPSTKYLLNHKFRVRPLNSDPTDKTDKYDGWGILGHLSCPKITIKGEEPGYVRFTIPFASDTSVTKIDDLDNEPKELPDQVKNEPSKSWVFFYNQRGKPVITDCSQWIMSWRAKLDREDIQNVMEKIITPATQAASHVVTTADIVNKLKVVASEDFLVSSIFCTVEAVDFADHFVLIDDKGNQMNQDLSWKFFATGLSQYWQGMKIHGGVPNPNNFVLGYAVSQKLPTLKEKHPELNRENTPVYFIPESFHMSTTQGSDFTNGTLNYLFLNHDTKTVPPAGAGILQNDLFKTTRMTSKNSDAVMALSKDVFLSRWLGGEIIHNLHFDLASARDNFWKLVKSQGASDSDYGQWIVNDYPEVAITKNGDKTVATLWTANTSKEVNVDDYGLIHVMLHWQGESKTTIEVDSSLIEKGLTGGDLGDTTRDIDATVTWNYYARTLLETATQGHVGGWSEAAEHGVAISLTEKIKLTIKDDSAGNWTVEANLPGSTLPHSYQEMISRMQDMSGQVSGKPDYQNGNTCMYWLSTHGIFWGLNFVTIFISYLQKLGLLPTVYGNPAQSAAWEASKTYQKICNLVDSLKYTVMLPGGEAFAFKGLDTDGDGACYSHLAYKMGATGVKASK